MRGLSHRRIVAGHGGRPAICASGIVRSGGLRPQPFLDVSFEGGKSSHDFGLDAADLLFARSGWSTGIGDVMNASRRVALRFETIANDDGADDVGVRADGPGVGPLIVQDDPIKYDSAATQAPLLAELLATRQRSIGGGFDLDRGLAPERTKVRVAKEIVDCPHRRVDQDVVLKTKGYGHC